ncbi:MAG: AMP-binding protein [Anaerolineae bacterium]
MNAASWSANYEAGVPQSLSEPSPHASFHSIVAAAAADAPGYRFLECYGRGTRFAELDALADRVATSLARDGFVRGDVALVALPNGLHLAATALGVLKAGGIVAPLDPGAGAQAAAAAVRDVEPAVAFTTPSLSSAVGEALAGFGGQLVVVRPESALPLSVRLMHRVGSVATHRVRGNGCRGALSWRSWLSRDADAPDVTVAPHDPAYIVLDEAGGTSVCTFRHQHLVSGARQLSVWLTDAIPGDDTWLMLEPLATPFGLVAGLGAAALLRSRVVLLPQWQARDVLDALRYHRPAYVAAGGDSVAVLADAPDLARAYTSSVRAWLVSRPAGGDVVRRFEDATGLGVCQGYGPPCTAGLVTCNPVNSRRARGSIGLPMPGVDVRLVVGDVLVIEPGVPGRLQLRGPNVSADGDWLDTGVDAAYDQSGFLFLAGFRNRLARETVAIANSA